MKKRYILMAALIAIAFCVGVAGCKSAPKAPDTDEIVPDFEMEDTLAEIDEDFEDFEEFEDEPAFALEDMEDGDDGEDEFLAFDEPEEVPEVAIVPEPELEFELEPEQEPEPEPAISPPIVTAVTPPVPPPSAAPPPPAPQPSPMVAPTPQVAPTPPRPVAPTPSPQMAPPSAPPPMVAPTPQVAPPSVAPEPPPQMAPPSASPPMVAPTPQVAPPLYDGPELPYPSTGFRDRPDDSILFSRSVRATAGQLIEVPFRGTGWVYLGEAGSQRGIVYDSRRLDPEGQSFIFRAQLPGEYALKFYRQDFIRDFILNDYVQVVVGPPPEATGTGWFNPPIDRNRVVAEPRWPSPLTEAQSLRPQPPVPSTGAAGSRTAPASAATAPVQSPATPSVQPQTASPTQPPTTPQTAPSASPRRESPVPESVPAPPPQAAPTPQVAPPPANGDEDQPDIPLNIDPETYLEKAKEEFDAGRIASAIAFLDRFRGHYPLETDELLWLYGQFYEANSPYRDILTSLGYYRRLVDEYPQSSRYDDARRRIAYLQRYYINIH